MVINLDCETNLQAPSDNNMSTRSPRPLSSPSNKLTVPVSLPVPPPPVHVPDLKPAPDTTCNAYEDYIHLSNIIEIWNMREFPAWQNEAVLKPALHALEFTFRFISIVLSDPRPYTNHRKWTRRLESLTTSQLELISTLCEHDTSTTPISNNNENVGVLTREGSSAEVWRLNDGDDATVFVSQVSEESLLPRLATWKRSADVAKRIQFAIEHQMMRCPYTLGLGEPNLTGKPSLQYDIVCKPTKLHSVSKTPPDHANVSNHENRTVFTTQQILEAWIHVAKQVLERIVEEIESNKFELANQDCYILEKIWKLLTKIEDLHLLMDPDDFLRLKNQLDIKTETESESICFRSRSLIEITKLSKNLRHKVPYILGVEVDPMGGPVVQEAALKLYRKKQDAVKIHLLQGLQAVEVAVKKFYYAYKQVLVVVMGSVEAKGNVAAVTVDLNDSLARIFLEPTYFPSLDGAKTFLGDYWSHEGRGR